MKILLNVSLLLACFLLLRIYAYKMAATVADGYNLTSKTFAPYISNISKHWTVPVDYLHVPSMHAGKLFDQPRKFSDLERKFQAEVSCNNHTKSCRSFPAIWNTRTKISKTILTEKVVLQKKNIHYLP